MLRHIVTKTFNRITVDGDTSTNDTCVVLANGLAGNAPITGPGADYDALVEALRYVCEYEAKMIASDGEGAGRLVTCAGGQGVPFDEDLAKKVLSEPEVVILVTLTAGDATCSCWGCDLTYDYVKINGDYRS